MTDMPTEEEIKLLTGKAHAIYESKLKSILEPQFNGQIVAIHVDSGDYEVAKHSATATRAIRARHPGTLALILDIGPPRIDSLTMRMLGSQILSGQIK